VDIVTISPKFQVVIPREIRERLGIGSFQHAISKGS
jgi:bifunctional DNA-binding transcriptional regulator/antitoxin component of YhaV-PrlF toxin-antitoxin module